MRYPHLIFDLDDTLIDSFGSYVAMHQRIAGDLGMRVPEREELVVYLDTWEETLLHIWPDIDLQPFYARYEELADEFVYPAVSGVHDMLDEVRGMGHKLWIVTKRSRRRLAQRMGQAKLDPALFEGIYTVEDQPAPKPDPRCFEPVWNAKPDLARERCIYVGDRLDDAHAANAAGVRFVGVGTGPEGAPVFEGHVPANDRLVSAAELPDWLRR